MNWPSIVRKPLSLALMAVRTCSGAGVNLDGWRFFDGARNGLEMPASRLGSTDAGAAVAAGAFDGRWRGRGTPSPASTGSATTAERPAATVRRAAWRSPDPVLQRVISGALLLLTVKRANAPCCPGRAY